MVREILFLHIGQCGNQLGREFWSVAIKEYLSKELIGKKDSVGKDSFVNDSMSSFFENNIADECETKSEKHNLKARAILIDTEMGVTNETMKSSISSYFDEHNIFTQQSGAGNNWSQGYMYYGKAYGSLINDLIRKNVERCDSLQSFYITSSLGGGTGSGLGSYILEMLNDDYRQIKFSNCVFPSAFDDVITSPYNSFFALAKIHEFSSCVLPVSNDALLNILDCNKLKDQENDKSNYSKMNNIVANVILNLTSSMRFEGALNVDINEICTNLIPYPFFNFLLSSLSPCIETESIRTFDHLFKNVLNHNNQMLIANPRDGLNLSMAFLVRGNVNISDVTKNVLQVKKNLKILTYNKDATKIGLCNVCPLSQPYSLLCLMNSCEMRNSFVQILNRFSKLFKRKAHLHHYLEYLTMEEIIEFREKIQNLIVEYDYIQRYAYCSPKFLNKKTLDLLGYRINEELVMKQKRGKGSNIGSENRSENKIGSTAKQDTDDKAYITSPVTDETCPHFLKSFVKNWDRKMNWYDFKSRPII